MIESKLTIYLEQEFHLLCRKLTHITVIVVILLAVVAWWFGIEVKGNTATLVGMAFIIIAAFTLKIPHIIYRYMLNKYKDEPEKLSALGPNWSEFRDNAKQRR